jgi:hypothetical protein
MTRDQLLRQLRRECKSRGWVLEVDKKLGKGSHYRLSVNGRKTTIKAGELSPRYCELIREQLGLT